MQSIKESKKILVTTPSRPNIDNYVSVYSIVTKLKKDLNKEVDIGIDGRFPTNFLSRLNLSNIKIINKLPPRKFIIELPKQQEKVENIQWSQEDDKLNLFVSMTKGNLNAENMRAKVVGSDYGAIIVVGANSIEELGELYNSGKDTFNEANVVSIGGRIKKEGIKVDLEVDEKHSSVSEDTYNFLKKIGPNFDTDVASALLAGIFFSTNNFKKDIKDPKTYITASELVKAGGQNTMAQDILEKTRPYTNEQPLLQSRKEDLPNKPTNNASQTEGLKQSQKNAEPNK
jgi:nanoRNase/pAp phosphatase (c-di-AMP/oligoRNAs hydrolase)